MPPRNPLTNPISGYGTRTSSFKRHQDQLAAGEKEAERKIERLRALRLAREAQGSEAQGTEAASPPLGEEAPDRTGAQATDQPKEPQ